MRGNRFILAVIFCTFACFGQLAGAQAEEAVPPVVRYAGVLRDGADAPLTGERLVTFALYEAAEGGEPLWSESRAVTADENGRFAIFLGQRAPLPPEVFSAYKSAWLQVSVAGEEVAERVMLVTVPYAAMAANAAALGGRPASDYVTKDQFGAMPAPTASGETVSAETDPISLNRTARPPRGDAGTGGSPGPRGSLTVSGGTVAIVEGFNDSTQQAIALALNPNGGNVGVGLLAPTEKLEVAGNLKVAGNASVTGNVTGTFTGALGNLVDLPFGQVSGVPAFARRDETNTFTAANTFSLGTTFGGSATFNSGTTFGGAATFNAAATFNGAPMVNGNLTISGPLTNGIIFADGSKQTTAATGGGGGGTTIISGSLTLNTPHTIVSSECTDAGPVTVTGAQPGMVVALSPTVDPMTVGSNWDSVTWFGFVSAANQVRVRFCKFGRNNSSLTQSLTFNIRLIP